ncbi:outer membrane protein assembly factor BamB family protein [Halomicrococcus gelatinilyticus]|uniref:outer membrane protein assembly factor BamB family protein n=1 Tax=Halomicrococcus gelatinilyticus TaxID=1702103 RepID=UPI002E161931
MTSLRADRRTVLGVAGSALVGGLFTVATHGTTDESATSNAASATWPMARYDAAGTGHAPDMVGPAGDVAVRWKRAAYGHVADPPSPVLHDGRLYYSAADRFLVVDADDGTVRHEIANGTFYSPPCLLAETAYANETLAVADRTGLLGVNPTGGVDLFGSSYRWSNRWRYPDRERDAHAPPPRSRPTPPPVVADDTLVYAGQIDDEDAVVALDPSSAERRWRAGSYPDPRRPVVAEDAVFVVSGRGRVRALDLNDGSELWRTTIREPTVNAPAVANGRLYLTDRWNVYAFDTTTGARVWRRPTETPVGTPPVVAGRTLYVQTELSAGPLLALDAATGETLWTAPYGNRNSTPVVAGDTLYLPSHYDLYALDIATGAERWRFEAAGSVSTPVVADGRVYVAGGNVLYALEAQP